MSYQSKALAAGERFEIAGNALFFRLMTTTGAVRVQFYNNGSPAGDAENVLGGYWREGGFDRVAITDMSGRANTVEVITDVAVVGYDRLSISGGVSVNPVAGAPTQAAAAVTNASARLVAANAERKYLMVQNKSATGTIYLNLAGAAATVGNGIKVPPGGYYESGAGWVSGAEVFVIGDLASNPDVVVVEGA